MCDPAQQLTLHPHHTFIFPCHQIRSRFHCNFEFHLHPNKTPLATENTPPTFALTFVFIETAKGHYRRSRSAFRNILFLNWINLFSFISSTIYLIYSLSLSLSLSFFSLQHRACYSPTKLSANGESCILSFRVH